MEVRAVADAVGLAALASVSVGLWTLRVALAARGRRLTATTVAAVEAVLFTVAFGSVVGTLHDPVRVIAYGIGVAVGTMAGMHVEPRLAPGQSAVRVVVDGAAVEEAAALRAAGWPVTATRADGVRGPVTVLTAALRDDAVRRFLADAGRIAPTGYVTVEALRAVHPAPLPPGLHVPTRPGRARVRASTGQR